MLLLVVGGVILTRNLKIIPSFAQSFLELVIEGLYNLFNGILAEHTKKIFPLLATLFLFIITANWLGLLPGVGSIYIEEDLKEVRQEEIIDEDLAHPEEIKKVPLFRGATADLNTTLALALVAVASIQYYGVKSLGFKTHLSKYLNFKDPIYFFVGILEIISELSRVISFAFRLFGNIFAGEVLLTIFASLIPFIVPIPFLALEVFVGFIQALVFVLLTAVLLNVAMSHSEH